MKSRPVTRRAFAGALGLGALTMLTACGRAERRTTATEDGGDRTPRPPAPQPLPQPPTLTIATLDADPLSARLAQDLQSYLTGHLRDHTVELATEDTDTPDGRRIFVTSLALGGEGVAETMQRLQLTRYFAPVTHWRLPLRLLAHDELAGIFSGRLTDWAQLGSPVAGPIERLDFTPAGKVDVPGAPQPIPAVAAYDTYEALVAGLEEHPFGIALLPLDAIDFRVQALALDSLDTDPLAGRGDLRAYPLRRDLWLGWDDRLGAGMIDAAAGFAAQQGYVTDLITPPGNPITLTVAGDIIFGRTVHSRMVRYGDWAHPLRGVAPRLQQADLTIADLECSLSDNTEKPADPFTFYFTTNSAAVTGLTLAGIDGVSLANNHSMNFGRLGLTDTMTVLGQHGIKWFGGGLNLDEARKPATFEVKGVTIAWLGYDGISAAEYGAGPDWAGTCPLDPRLVVDDIAAAKVAGADVVIPFFHWSEEYVAVPSAAMRRIAHLAIDHGATLVIGSHPHWVQGAEWYNGAPILYSLGNFVFDQEWSIETKQGMFAEIVLRNKRPVRVRLAPVLIEDYNRPRILDVTEGLPVLQRVYDAADAIKAMD